MPVHKERRGNFFFQERCGPGGGGVQPLKEGSCSLQICKCFSLAFLPPFGEARRIIQGCVVRLIHASEGDGFFLASLPLPVFRFYLGLHLLQSASLAILQPSVSRCEGGTLRSVGVWSEVCLLRERPRGNHDGSIAEPASFKLAGMKK